MNHKFKTKHKVLIYCLSVLFLALVVFLFWLYKGALTSAKVKVLTAIPFPMALVSGSPIPANEFFVRYNMGTKLLESGKESQDAANLKQAIYNGIIHDREVAMLVSKYASEPTIKEIDSEYDKIASEANLENENSFESLLKKYNLSANNYKSEFVKPKLLLQNLAIWHSTQANLNTANYALANSLLSRIKNGEDMGLLAAAFSQTNTEKDVSGDLGFVDVPQILPEMREPVSAMAIGEAKIIPSRLGLHIIKLEEKNGNKLHLRQIFLADTSFESWLNSQIQNFQIFKFINF